jgi:hypothetical protein
VVAASMTTLLLAAPAAAHHVGYYTPRDNDLSASYKQIKFALLAQKFDVAARLYQEGALRKELRRRAAALPPGLDASIGTALRAGRAEEAEHGMMLFFVALLRDLTAETERRLEDREASPEARAAAARKLLEAIWRYYNLVDFVVTRHQPAAGGGIRLAFDEAEVHVKEGAEPAPERALPPLRTIARILTGVLEAASPSARRDS